jgi:hypothetical protein
MGGRRRRRFGGRWRVGARSQPLIFEGSESILFAGYFSNWKHRAPPPQRRRVAPPSALSRLLSECTFDHHPLYLAQRSFTPTRYHVTSKPLLAPRRRRTPPAFARMKYLFGEGGGCLTAQVWVIDDFSTFAAVDKDNHGVFYTRDVYVVLHPPLDEKEGASLFLWRGASSTAFQILAWQHNLKSRLFASIGKPKIAVPPPLPPPPSTRQLELREGKETPEFLSLFVNKFVICDVVLGSLNAKNNRALSQAASRGLARRGGCLRRGVALLLLKVIADSTLAPSKPILWGGGGVANRIRLPAFLDRIGSSF